MKKILVLIIILMAGTVHAANQKLTALTELTAVADADQMYVVDMTTTVERRITVLNLFDTIDTFTKLNTIVADKTLVNEEDAATWDALGTFNLGITITTGDPFTLGVVRWDNGSDLMDGEQIANDTIDVDSLDWGAFTDLGESGVVVWTNLAEGELTDQVIVTGDIKDGTILEADLNSTNAPTDNFVLSYNLASLNFTWVAAGVGDLLADGTVPLTANWDVGAFTITGTQFISDIAGGTAPFVVTSTTEVANLKAATATLATSATALVTPRTIGGVNFDGSANIVPTTIAVTDTADATSFVALWESATGDLLPQSDLGLTYNAGTANLATTTFTGALVGNADTVTTNANLTGDVTSVGNAATIADNVTVTGWTLGAALATTLTVTNNIKDEPKHLIFNIINPLGAQTEDNEICLIPSLDADITITNIEVTLNSAANEVQGDLKYADTFIGLANATVINVFDTTSGILSDNTITSGAMAAGKAMYIAFDVAPNTAITQMCVDITFKYD